VCDRDDATRLHMTPLPWPPSLRRTPRAIEVHRLLSKLPPGLRVVDLAERLRLNQPYVWRLAGLFGYVTAADLLRERWAAVDWTQSDTQVARAMGVSRQAAAGRRRRAGKLHLLPRRKAETL
jgi:hypothetical protein